MLRFLINASFGGTALVRGMRFIESSAYSDPSVNGVVLTSRWRLFEAWRLLDEIQYWWWYIFETLPWKDRTFCFNCFNDVFYSSVLTRSLEGTLYGETAKKAVNLYLISSDRDTKYKFAAFFAIWILLPKLNISKLGFRMFSFVYY